MALAPSTVQNMPEHFSREAITVLASSLFGVGYDESSGGDADGTDSLAKRCHRLKIHGLVLVFLS
jgi:hypothetical protein